VKEIIFSLAFLFTNGNIIDTNLKLHKYDKENFKKIYFSKNKNKINAYCIKHSESEDIEKSNFNHHNEGQKTNYKVSRTEKKTDAEVIKNQSDK
tara:strand:- start:1308 stop:1589 length:282 start_codon:yes stop_codon:yes gene_type:complete